MNISGNLPAEGSVMSTSWLLTLSVYCLVLNKSIKTLEIPETCRVVTICMCVTFHIIHSNCTRVIIHINNKEIAEIAAFKLNVNRSNSQCG